MYLGWNVSYNHLVPDKARVTRLLESEMPTTKKGTSSISRPFKYIKIMSELQFYKTNECINPAYELHERI